MEHMKIEKNCSKVYQYRDPEEMPVKGVEETNNMADTD